MGNKDVNLLDILIFIIIPEYTSLTSFIKRTENFIFLYNKEEISA